MDVRWRQCLLDTAITIASRSGLSLVAGSSFGFDTTRIYVTAAESTFGEPFVRIAAGTEHWLAINQLADVIALAVRTLSEAYAEAHGSER